MFISSLILSFEGSSPAGVESKIHTSLEGQAPNHDSRLIGTADHTEKSHTASGARSNRALKLDWALAHNMSQKNYGPHKSDDREYYMLDQADKIVTGQLQVAFSDVWRITPPAP